MAGGDDIMHIDFGKTASDYRQYRAGFPKAFFERIDCLGLVGPGKRILDLGTGTGTIARGIAKTGSDVKGIDISQEMLDEAKRLDRMAGVTVVYERRSAGNSNLASGSFDVVTAGQCWHWFDRPKTAREVFRLLATGGIIIIVHFDWIPLPGNMVAKTEALITRYNPLWKGAGGNGFHLDWLTDLSEAGFQSLETFSFDIAVEYSHEAWRGRIRASAGVGAALPPELVSRFDRDLADLLGSQFPGDPMQVPHRVFAVLGQKGHELDLAP